MHLDISLDVGSPVVYPSYVYLYYQTDRQADVRFYNTVNAKRHTGNKILRFEIKCKGEGLVKPRVTASL